MVLIFTGRGAPRWIIPGALVSPLPFAEAGRKGIRAARPQYDAWPDIVVRAEWHNPEDVRASYLTASILKAGLR
jgi:mRNA-degrading endonuclease HigB of HigAB toxin-antitoxin module